MKLIRILPALMLLPLLFLIPIGSAEVINTNYSYSISEDFGYDAEFGRSMDKGDFNGDGHMDVVVGAPGSDKAYVLFGSDTGLEKSPSWSYSGDADTAFGTSVSSADVNNDGFDDVLVGASNHDEDYESNAGKAFLFLGSSAGISPSAKWTAMGDVDGMSYFGSCVEGVGDVNNDGFEDVMVGAYKQDNGPTSEGKAFLYIGDSNGLSAADAFNYTAEDTSSGFTGEIAGLGDINKDGFDDVAIGCNKAPGSPAYSSRMSGTVHVLHGTNAAGGHLESQDVWNHTAEGADDAFGFCIAAGDMNKNGYRDLIVGAPGAYGKDWWEGRVYIFHNYDGELHSEAETTLSGDEAESGYFGCSLDVGDVNGDSFDDLVVGEFGNFAHRHLAWIYYNDDGLSDTNREVLESADPSTGNAFGTQVVVAENANGTQAQVVVTNPLDESGDKSGDSGGAYVYDLAVVLDPLNTITDLTGEVLENQGIKLGWTWSGSHVTHIKIYRAETTGYWDAPVEYLTETITEGSWTDTNVVKGMTYIYKIKEMEGNRIGPESNEVQLKYMEADPSSDGSDTADEPTVEELDYLYNPNSKELFIYLPLEPGAPQANYKVYWYEDNEWVHVNSSYRHTQDAKVEFTLQNDSYNVDKKNHYKIVADGADGEQVLWQSDTSSKEAALMPWDFHPTNYWTWIEAIALILTVIVGIIGIVAYRAKRKKVVDHMERADKVIARDALTPEKKKEALKELKKDAEEQYRKKKIDDTQYLIIDKKITECIEEAGKKKADPPPPTD